MDIYRLNIFHHLLLFLCLFGDIGLASTGVKPKCIEEERQALVSFKQDLKDPSGRLLIEWVIITTSGKGFHATIAPVILPRWISGIHITHSKSAN
ncbi:receptor-like protein 12 [Prunus yedoensis var. nudiflora]|uniref:Receptor-like protein 12 n=1 Tax=Prunus yedoensis var. nudiflora TaxID=2094558 RepID=A0A314Z1E8_PRUYE|nr:receptor-like protein 12 [Prunus yedoensis var. nudiflora]